MPHPDTGGPAGVTEWLGASRRGGYPAPMRPTATLSRPALRAAAGLVIAAAAVAGAAPTASAAAKTPTSVSAAAGSVTAQVTYKRVTKPVRQYRTLRLTVQGPTGGLFEVRIPRNATSFSRPNLQLVDVSDDGIPDPIVRTFTGGVHCCTVTGMALSTPTGFAPPTGHFWGNYGYELVDLGGTPAPEFRSLDDRFAYEFASYAGSIPAIMIWAVRDGRLVDVTREFPDAIRADIADKATFFDDAVKSGFAEAVQAGTAAWVADLLLLRDFEGAKAVLAKADAAGFLRAPAESSGDTDFPEHLAKAMEAWGYVADAAVIGL